MKRGTCYRSSRAQLKTVPPCSLRSSSARVVAVSARVTSRHCLRRLSASRVRAETYETSMKLCTFEVRTHLGWQRRLGAVVRTDGDSTVVDLHFATANYLDNYRLAEALVPPSLRGLLEGGPVSMAVSYTHLTLPTIYSV